MASFSSPRKCLHCQVETDQLRNGWQRSDGSYAKLCETCCSEYERNTFCETFHLDSDGWRDCRICGKLMHCGCIMSFHMYDTLDYGGIACMACLDLDPIPSRNTISVVSSDLMNYSGAEYHSAGEPISGTGVSPDHPMPDLLPNETALQPVSSGPASPTAQSYTQLQSEAVTPSALHSYKQNKPGVEKPVFPSIGNETYLKPVSAEEPSLVPPTALACIPYTRGQERPLLLTAGDDRVSSGSSVHAMLPHEVPLQAVYSGQPIQIPSRTIHFRDPRQAVETPSIPFVVSAEFSIHSPLRYVIDSQSVFRGAPSEVPSPVLRVSEQNKSQSNVDSTALVPFVTHQLSQLDTSAKSTLRFMFEKSLSPSDADPRLSRLVLPKLCAEYFFPPIFEGQLLPMIIQDSTGRDWIFHYRCWKNGHGYMYVLEGMRGYMVLMDWKAGDKVIFHRIEPQGKFVIGTKKVPSDSAPSTVANYSCSLKGPLIMSFVQGTQKLSPHCENGSFWVQSCGIIKRETASRKLVHLYH